MTPIVSSILSIAETVIDRLIPDKAEAARVKDQILAEAARAEQQGVLAQIEVNKVQAENPNWFVSGGRPFIMWVCGAALAMHFVVGPTAIWLAGAFGRSLPPLPPIDNNLWELVMGMLGLSAMRSFEKFKGVARQ